MLDGVGVVSNRAIYTKSIELVQPEFIENKTYFYIYCNSQSGEATVGSACFGKNRYDLSIQSGNIYETKEDAQKVADKINLLIQEKGYFTLFQPNPMQIAERKGKEKCINQAKQY